MSFAGVAPMQQRSDIGAVPGGRSNALNGPKDTVLEKPRAVAAGERPRIAVVLPRGEAIRNFLYTGLIDELERDLDVTLLSVIPNERIATLLRGGGRTVHPLDESIDPWVVRIQRELLDLAHNRWLWSRAAQERWRLREAEAPSGVAWMKRRAKTVAAAVFAHRRALGWMSRVEERSSRTVRSTKEYVQLFERRRPALLFNGSHVHATAGSPAVRAARALGIPTAAFIFSWDNLTSQGRIVPPHDYYFVWNEQIRRQLLAMYDDVPPERVLVTGTPQFDPHFAARSWQTREEFCHQIGANPARPIVLYSTGMPNHMPAEPEIVAELARGLRALTQFGPPQLVVRVYPKDRTGRFAAVAASHEDVLLPPAPWETRWLTPEPEDGVILTNTLRHTAVGVNVASTISLELCMFDKPVVNVAFNPPSVPLDVVTYRDYYEFDHYRPVVESGAVSLARSPRELLDLVASGLQNPGAGRDARAALVRRFFGDTLDGRCHERVATTLRSIVDLVTSAN